MNEQFEETELSIWNNKWDAIYDFTPGGAVTGYRIMPPSVTSKSILKGETISNFAEEGLAPSTATTSSGKSRNSSLLRTCGAKHGPKGEGQSALLCVSACGRC